MNDRLLTSDPEVVDRYLAAHAGRKVIRASCKVGLNGLQEDYVWKISFGRPLCGVVADLVVVDDVDVTDKVVEWFIEHLMCRLYPGADVVVFGNGKLTEFLLGKEQEFLGFKQ